MPGRGRYRAGFDSATAGTRRFQGGTDQLVGGYRQNGSVGPFNYTDAANWSGGNISGLFQTNIYNGLTVQSIAVRKKAEKLSAQRVPKSPATRTLQWRPFGSVSRCSIAS